MNNFLTRIKRELDDPRRYQGRRGYVQLIEADVRELIGHFERLDTDFRDLRNTVGYTSIQKRLFDSINACFHEHGRKCDATLLTIIDALHPLLDEAVSKKIPSREKEDNFNTADPLSDGKPFLSGTFYETK